MGLWRLCRKFALKRRSIKLAVGPYELIEAERPISSAWIGQNPDRGAAEPSRLSAPCDFLLAEQSTVGCLAEEGDEAWRMARDLVFEIAGSSDEFLCRHLIRARRRPCDHRGQTTAVQQDRAVVFRAHFLRREARKMNDAPEAIPSSGEMMSRGGSSHAGIDPAKHHRKLSCDDIRECIDHGVSQQFS